MTSTRERWASLLVSGLLSFALGSCEWLESGAAGDSTCHPVRKCITLTCRDKLKEGRSSEPWKTCVDWCRTSRGIERSEATFCAEQIGVTCIRDWYADACVQARSRCKSGTFRPDDEGGC